MSVVIPDVAVECRRSATRSVFREVAQVLESGGHRFPRAPAEIQQDLDAYLEE